MAPRSKDDPPPLAMRPQGSAGRAFGVLMELINTPAYGFALDLLDIQPSSDVLEIGFGTGRLIELLLQRTEGRVFGLDPTPTMLAVAKTKAGVRRAGDRVSLKLGGDADLGGLPPLDRVVAAHSFLFWPDPQATARRLFALLKPGGRVVLVLRDHSRHDSGWLPNPLSRDPEEPQAALRLFESCGFTARLQHRGGMTALASDKYPLI